MKKPAEKRQGDADPVAHSVRRDLIAISIMRARE
jgi:hypothetical protein